MVQPPHNGSTEQTDKTHKAREKAVNLYPQREQEAAWEQAKWEWEKEKRQLKYQISSLESDLWEERGN